MGSYCRKRLRCKPPLEAFLNDRHVQADAADGFVFAPHLTPGGFDEFVAKVIPLLQERGVFRRDYDSDTLRGNLGLAPVIPQRELRTGS